MSNGLPGVAIVIVSYNSAGELAEFLPRLESALDGVPRHRLIVVDNASDDGSADLVRRLVPRALVINSGANLGYAAAINLGSRRVAGDDAILVLNADVRLRPGSVRALLEAVRDDSALGIAVPRVSRPDGSAEATLRRRPTPLRTWGETLLGARAGRLAPFGEIVHRPRPDRPADWANGAVLLVPGQVRRAVGPWREDLFLYGEEVDYCRRVRAAGWSIRQVASASVVHRGGEVGRDPALWAQLVTNRVVEAANDGPAAARRTWTALVIAQVLRLPLRRCTHRRALVALLRGRATLVRGFPTNPAAPPEFHAYLASSGAR